MPAISKKAKVDPMLAGVTQAIQFASDLPQSCTKMLISMVPGALGVPQEDRMPHQQKAVTMIGEVVHSVRARMQQALDDQEQCVRAIEESKAGLNTKVEEASAKAASAAEVLAVKKSALNDVSVILVTRKSELASAREAQESGDAPLTALGTEKQQYESLVAEEFRVVRDGTGTKAQSDKLMSLAKKLAGMDESLLQALPSTCSKTADQRGAFDSMVLDTLSRSLDDHVAGLSATLAGAAAGIQERAAAVQSAQAAFEDAKAEQQKAATNVGMAQTAEKQAQAELELARGAVTNFEPELLRASALRDERRAALENYLVWNADCFAMLRDKTNKVDEETPAAVGTEAIAPTAEAVTSRNDAGTVSAEEAKAC